MKKGLIYGGLFFGAILTQALACTVEKSVNINLSEPLGKSYLIITIAIAFYEAGKKKNVQLKQK